MEFMGIKFAPLDVPMTRRLQTLAAGIEFAAISLAGFTGIGITLFLLLYTRYWLLCLLYLLWIWIFDKNTCNEGGRRVEWLRRWIFWKYVKNYFPIQLKIEHGVELDPQRNYLFCSFPHGMLATGTRIAFGTNASDVDTLFPKHKAHVLTLKENFNIPFLRDYFLAHGICSASASSINWLMSSPGGGNIAVLVVGGAAEAFHCRPGQYKVVLKNRKGFVKLALKNGCPLVPVFSFGEVDIFDQVNNPEGSLLRNFQEWVKKVTRVAPVIPLGRGYFQYSFGMVPLRRPITIIVGKPLEVEKSERPTEEAIDAVHVKFIEELTNLFERHKHNYVQNADKIKLITE